MYVFVTSNSQTDPCRFQWNLMKLYTRFRLNGNSKFNCLCIIYFFAAGIQNSKENTLFVTTQPALTPCRRAFLEKLIVTQLVKKFPALHGTRRFITVFTRSSHWCLSWARCIQSTTSHPLSLRFILLLFSHLRLGFPSGHFPSGFPTKMLYAFIVSPVRATYPVHVIGKRTSYDSLCPLIQTHGSSSVSASYSQTTSTCVLLLGRPNFMAIQNNKKLQFSVF